MAKKRLKKKQEQKRQRELLQKIGLDERKARKVARDREKLLTYQKEIKKEQQKEKRRARDRARSKRMKELGIPLTGANRNMRGWSDKRFNEYVEQLTKQREKEAKKKARRERIAQSNDNVMLLFWRDKTAENYADRDMVRGYMNEYKYVSVDNLIQNIIFYLNTPEPIGSEIGTYSMMIVKESEAAQYISFMGAEHATSFSMSSSNEWMLMYKGKAKQYKPVVHAIHTIIRLLYDTSERAAFINDIIRRGLATVNPRMAERFARDIGFTMGGFAYGE